MQNGVRTYFNLEALRTAGEYVALKEDVHILSMIRKTNYIKNPEDIFLHDTVYT